LDRPTTEIVPTNKDTSNGGASSSGKAPAFQFYPKDFLTDGKVLMMSAEMRGLYITLLCIDWLEDGFPKHCLLKLAGFDWLGDDGGIRSGSEIEAQLLDCFVAHPKKEGWITNPRLQKERQAQIERRKERARSGQKGGNAKAGKRLHPVAELGLASSKPLANSSSSSSSPSSSPIINTPPNPPSGGTVADPPFKKTRKGKPKAEKYLQFYETDFEWPPKWGEQGKAFMASWVDFKVKKGEACILETYRMQIKEYAEDPKLFAAYVSRAMRNNWKGLCEHVPLEPIQNSSGHGPMTYEEKAEANWQKLKANLLAKGNTQ